MRTRRGRNLPLHISLWKKYPPMTVKLLLLSESGTTLAEETCGDGRRTALHLVLDRGLDKGSEERLVSVLQSKSAVFQPLYRRTLLPADTESPRRLFDRNHKTFAWSRLSRHNHAYLIERAATRIQAHARMRSATIHLKRCIHGAIVLQCAWRQKMARSLLQYKRDEKELHRRSAVLVQSWYRGCISRQVALVRATAAESIHDWLANDTEFFPRLEEKICACEVIQDWIRPILREELSRRAVARAMILSFVLGAPRLARIRRRVEFLRLRRDIVPFECASACAKLRDLRSSFAMLFIKTWLPHSTRLSHIRKKKRSAMEIQRRWRGRNVRKMIHEKRVAATSIEKKYGVEPGLEALYGG